MICPQANPHVIQKICHTFSRHCSFILGLVLLLSFWIRQLLRNVCVAFKKCVCCVSLNCSFQKCLSRVVLHCSFCKCIPFLQRLKNVCFGFYNIAAFDFVLHFSTLQLLKTFYVAFFCIAAFENIVCFIFLHCSFWKHFRLRFSTLQLLKTLYVAFFYIEAF